MQVICVFVHCTRFLLVQFDLNSKKCAHFQSLFVYIRVFYSDCTDFHEIDVQEVRLTLYILVG
jgi:hypothetical protein